jgi:ketosteroid isomerase-like protein
VNTFLTYYAPDATAYPQGMPQVTGAALKDTYKQMASSPGFELQFTPTKAEVSSAGDVGWTTGTYTMTMNGAQDKGKYVAVWRKQSDKSWKVVEDIFNSDGGAAPPPSQHVTVEASGLTWGEPPPSMPAVAKLAVVAGDPTQPGPFIIRAQLPAGYKIAPHWHPADEHITVLSGTLLIGMGDVWDESKTQAVTASGFTSLPATMHHFAGAKGPTTIQVHGNGPFVLMYVNPADDPSKGK